MKNKSQYIGEYAAILSIIEVGLGSFLHAVKTPFSGHFLSLNQGFFLSQAVLKSKYKSKTIPLNISNICALLKSLSPAGKKLTPMLAISAQGLLFNVGTLLFGANIFGITVGMVLLALWGFIQPVLIYLILYGYTIIDVGIYYLEKLNKVLPITESTLLIAVLLLVSIKIVLAIAVSIMSHKLSDVKISQYKDFLISKSKVKPKGLKVAPTTFFQKCIQAFKDLFNPLFIFSFVLTAVFFAFSMADFSTAAWLLMRPLALGYLLFLGIQIVPIDKITSKNSALAVAINKLKGSA